MTASVVLLPLTFTSALLVFTFLSIVSILSLVCPVMYLETRGDMATVIPGKELLRCISSFGFVESILSIGYSGITTRGGGAAAVSLLGKECCYDISEIQVSERLFSPIPLPV